MHIQLHTDGGARGNPGPAGAGVYINAPDGIHSFGYYLGDDLTNNQAEYLGLLLGLRMVAELYDGASVTLDVNMDSELVIKQVNGEYRVKDEGLKKLYDKVQRESAGFSVVQFSHVKRAENAHADALVNTVLDSIDGIIEPTTKV